MENKCKHQVLREMAYDLNQDHKKAIQIFMTLFEFCSLTESTKGAIAAHERDRLFKKISELVE